ncbi:ribosomal L27 protein-domain-containing protein [Lasiosphaeria miniovina]|uniref:Large ribosomal subunit protein bL27m n=1 Tax=Lasiosphaeria miniovina TaxID=1954250 RepID=A0AA40E9A3_9PEZI|nr:ribosomal L27 protein-domain-containing protein [Lasiosphaeria miniovina]KAK0728796.1 ribosomal L27 protein-domain-containing protein [Lasiosphaeria miniovina]
MHIVQLQRPLQRAAASSCLQLLRPTTTRTATAARLSDGLARLQINDSAAAQGRRYASVKAQGAYKIPNKKTLPKKMGAKRTGDQYVITGNIIYKQRGTIWHPGENTIMGRDHTIHSAIAGYVKYYRDPQRHPKRQYIGVVYDRNDKLPYPVGAPRKRKLGFVAVPRKIIEHTEGGIGPSGIPYTVTRHEVTEDTPATETVIVSATATETAEPATAEAEQPEEPAGPLDGNAILSALIKEKLQRRAEYKAKTKLAQEKLEKEMAARRGTRIFRLQDDYSYRESNWEIGRLVGDTGGSIPGTEKTASRKALLRSKRVARTVHKMAIKQRMLEKAGRREVYRGLVRAKRARMAEENKANRAAVKAAAAAEKLAQQAKKAATKGGKGGEGGGEGEVKV